MDIWSVGCMFGGFIFNKKYLFLGQDNEDQLIQIVNYLGSADLKTYLDKYNIQIKSKQIKNLRNHSKKPLSYLYDEKTSFISPESIDLFNQMINYDHEQRITAHEALYHPFFDDVREKFEN